MKIITDIPIEVAYGDNIIVKLDSYKELEIAESTMGILSIHSNLGSAYITTNFTIFNQSLTKRNIRYFGNIVVSEDSEKKDRNGLPVINVMRRY